MPLAANVMYRILRNDFNRIAGSHRWAFTIDAGNTHLLILDADAGPEHF